MSCELSPLERQRDLRHFAGESQRTGFLVGMSERTHQGSSIVAHRKPIELGAALTEQIERRHEGAFEQRIEGGHGCQRSTTSATASPPPMQSVASPRLALCAGI